VGVLEVEGELNKAVEKERGAGEFDEDDDEQAHGEGSAVEEGGGSVTRAGAPPP